MQIDHEPRCVQLKRTIQETLVQEYQGLSPAEARERQRDRIEADPALAAFLKKVAMPKPDHANA